MSDKLIMKEFFDEGALAFMQSSFHESVSSFSKVIDLDSKYRLAHISRGAAYLRLGMVNEAVADFDRVLENQPGNAKAYHLRGLAHEMLGNSDLALGDFGKAIEIDPEYSAAYYSRITLKTKIGKEEQALEDVLMFTQLTEKRIQEFSTENNIWRSQHLKLEEDGMTTDTFDR